MKLKQARDAWTALDKLLSEVSSVSLSMKLRKPYHALEQAARDYRQEYWQIVERNAQRAEGGRLLRPTPDQVAIKDPEKFREDIQELDEYEVSVDLGDCKISIRELEQAKIDMKGIGFVLDALADVGLLAEEG